MSETEAAELRGRLEAFEWRMGGPLKGDMRHKSHLLFAWLAELVRRNSILDTVEDLHGPDRLCWTTNFFINRRPIRPLCRGVRTRPIGASAPLMS